MWEQYSNIIPFIAVDSGVINTVADWVMSNNYKTVLVVSDPNTRRVAGERVIGMLKNAGITVLDCSFANNEPVPDEFSIGFITAFYSPETDLILGVGSGTINDICTFVGAKVNCPAAIVGTAPSMDGYASLGSAMLLDGIKVTPPTACPVAIFCDIDILAEAPLLLTAAGLGDMLGKITALADWRLANLLTNEPMPENIVAIMETALDKIIKGVPHLSKRDPGVIKSVTEGLILSGIAMSLYGDSRPASGTEHHLAHFWEMRMVAEGLKPALHGIKVGIATIVGLILWKKLALYLSDCKENQYIDPLHYPKQQETIPAQASTHYESNIRRLYGRTADTILQTENPVLSAGFLRSNQLEILDIANSLPEPEDVAEMLKAVRAPVNPSEICLSDDTLKDSIIYARDRKKTFTILQLLGNLGCLESFANYVVYYLSKSALTGVKCLVLDMDGTIYLSNNIFPYTKRFLEYLDETGLDYIFYTNNSSQNAAYYINKLHNMGIDIKPDRLMMSTHVLLAHLECRTGVGSTGGNGIKHGKRVFVAGTKALRDDFCAAGYTLDESNPDFAVLGFDMDMDYKRLAKLCDFVRSGLPYYGVHIDYNCPVEGGFIPDCGSLAAAVTASTGITPEFFGKPSRYTLDYIIQKTGYNENEICFIGDRLYTDIAIAGNSEARSVLVLSGETKRCDLSGSTFVPDLTVNDLTELVDYLHT
ncbi:MAG: iron-containing alcohol dehydrogenase [Oscillospiraceae bacterium]|nr:iron-containing alcohol dehydrogenase [Oscillospiraceae bacterium]